MYVCIRIPVYILYVSMPLAFLGVSLLLANLSLRYSPQLIRYDYTNYISSLKVCQIRQSAGTRGYIQTHRHDHEFCCIRSVSLHRVHSEIL